MNNLQVVPCTCGSTHDVTHKFCQICGGRILPALGTPVTDETLLSPVHPTIAVITPEQQKCGRCGTLVSPKDQICPESSCHANFAEVDKIDLDQLSLAEQGRWHPKAAIVQPVQPTHRPIPRAVWVVLAIFFVLSLIGCGGLVTWFFGGYAASQAVAVITVVTTATSAPTAKTSLIPTATRTRVPSPTTAPSTTPIPTSAPTSTTVPTSAPTATSIPTEAPTATIAPTVAPTAQPTIAPTMRPTTVPVKKITDPSGTWSGSGTDYAQGQVIPAGQPHAGDSASGCVSGSAKDKSGKALAGILIHYAAEGDRFPGSAVSAADGNWAFCGGAGAWNFRVGVVGHGEANFTVHIFAGWRTFVTVIKERK